MSRSMTVKIKDYYRLEGIKENDPNNPLNVKKNIQRNSIIGQSVGVPCLIAYVDLCNHGQPKSFKNISKNYISLGTKEGFFFHSSSNNWNPGDEIIFNYSSLPSTLNIAMNYGIIIKKNIFETSQVLIKDIYILNNEQINFCREIHCFPGEVKTVNQVHKERKDLINYNTLNENLLNYGRVRALKGKFDFKKLHKKYLKDKSFSKSNEMSSLIFYFNTMKDQLKIDGKLSKISIEGGSNLKFKISEIQKSEKRESHESLEDVKKATVTANILDTILVVKHITTVHTNYVIDKIISGNDQAVKALKEKILSKI